MRKPLFVCFVFILLMFSGSAAMAEVQDFKEFSIDLQEGWQAVRDITETPHGFLIGFAGPPDGDRKNITLTLTSAAGKSMTELVADSKKRMKDRGLELTIIEQTDMRCVYTGEQAGMPLKMISALEANKQKLVIIVLLGQGDEMERMARSIKFKNYSFALFP